MTVARIPNETSATAGILEPGRTCWVVAGATEAGLLVDCRDYYRAFMDAARQARRYILMAGWQFDSDVHLLRGAEAQRAGCDVRLLPFLRDLCLANPQLRIYMLCWDYSPAFYFQREWFQDHKFNSAAPGQLVFRFDDRHPVGGSHHQKFVVVDGVLGFAGSADICNDRWDRRDHLASCEDRCWPTGQDPYGPYHEVQAYLRGPAVSHLQELFAARWLSAGCQPLELPPALPDVPVTIRPSVRLGPIEVGLSRTFPATLVPEHEQIREIEQLLIDAIDSAQELIYVENQYYGSRAVLAALERRMRDRDRPKLQVVFVCCKELRSLSERVSMATSQAIMFARLRRVAAEHGHSFAAYDVFACQPRPDGTGDKAVFIHSKVMIVDDRFLTAGSANLNNRSMGLDSEVNLSCETADPASPLARNIRRARVSLLAEHTGVRSRDELRQLYPVAGLVERLDRFAADPAYRLAPHAVEEAASAEEITLDLDRPLGALFFERVAPSKRDMVRAGLHRARRRIGRWRQRLRRRAVASPLQVARRPNPVWTVLVQYARRFGLPVFVLVLGGLLLWGCFLVVRKLFLAS